MKIITIAVLITLVYGCNNQGTYEAIQQGQRFECEKLPLGQYEECVRELDTPYHEYERDRQEAINAEQS